MQAQLCRDSQVQQGWARFFVPTRFGAVYVRLRGQNRFAHPAESLPLVTADLSEIQTAAIPNLYVAGCDLGGISNRGYMGGLSQALVTGRAAGTAAASGG